MIRKSVNQRNRNLMTKYGHHRKGLNVGIKKLQPPPGTYGQPFSGCIGLNISGCQSIIIDVNTLTEIAGNTIMLSARAYPSGIYDVIFYVDENPINPIPITTYPDGTATISWDTTGQSPGLYNMTVEVVGTQCISSPLAIALVSTNCTGITIDTPGPITAYIGDIVDISVTAQVTDLSIVELREITLGMRIGSCIIDPTVGSSCTANLDTTEAPPGTYNVMAVIGYGDTQQCASETIEAMILPSEVEVCFRSNPSGASIEIDGIIQTGKTTVLSETQPLDGIEECTTESTIVVSNRTPHTYTITLEGYQPAEYMVDSFFDISYTIDVEDLDPLPANIVSKTLTVDRNTCTEPCTVVGSVSWVNEGGETGTFDPTILVNDLPTSLGLTETIEPRQEITHEFSLENLIAGTYVVQAFPDSGTSPQTIDVTSPIPCEMISMSLTSTEPIIIGGSRTLTAKVTPAGHYLVDFYDGLELLGEVMSDPLGIATFTWNTTPMTIIETHHVTAKVPDSTCISGEILIDVLSPFCSIILIPLTENVIKGNTIRLTATVTPAGVYDIIFRDGEIVIATVTSSPDGISTYDWDTTDITEGEHNITANVVTPIQCSSDISIITVEQVVQAGLGGVIALGLTAGVIYSMMMRPK